MGSGHAKGSDTSKERQERNDASGITSRVQQATYNLLSDVGAEGVTSAELTDRWGIGEGMSSSALSHLHRAGKITRVKMRRKRHEIYVLPEYVNGREESPYRPRNKPDRHVRELPDATVLEAMRKSGIAPTRLEAIRAFLAALP
jgi:ribosomal protein S25